MARLLLLIAAAVLFILAALTFFFVGAPTLHLIAAGLACWVIATVVAPGTVAP